MATSLLCPRCGFDLRGTPGDICGECGLEIDRVAIRESGFPWAHRRQIGRMRAFAQTVWRVSIRSASLTMETARPQRLSDGRSFARIVGAIVALACLIPPGLRAYEDPSMEDLAISASELLSDADRSLDLEMPWSAGATMWPTLLVVVALLGFYLTGLPRTVLVRRSFDPDRRDRVAAISYYICAPLVFLLPGSVFFAIRWLCESGPLQDWSFAGDVERICIVLADVVWLAALALFAIRVGQWRCRTSHCGLGGAVIAVAQLAALAAFGLFVLIIWFVWCVGFVRIVVEGRYA